jgi:hypothetical protein
MATGSVQRRRGGGRRRDGRGDGTAGCGDEDGRATVGPGRGGVRRRDGRGDGEEAGDGTGAAMASRSSGSLAAMEKNGAVGENFQTVGLYRRSISPGWWDEPGP